MNRQIWLLVSGCVWAVMMFFLFQAEIRPYFEYQAPPSYRQAFGRNTAPEVQKRAVFLGRERIGDAETFADPTASGGPQLRSRFLMHLKPFGLPDMGDDRVYVTSEVRLDASFQLQEIRTRGQLQSIPFTMRGDRQADKLRVLFEVKPLFRMERLVDFPPDATLSDSFLPYQGGVKLSEGRKWKMKLLDVEGLASAGGKTDNTFVERYAAVTGREPVEIRGREVAAFRIEVRKEPNDPLWAYLVWVDEEGTVLKQQSKIRGLICEVVLEEKRTLTEDQAKAFEWSVKPP